MAQFWIVQTFKFIMIYVYGYTMPMHHWSKYLCSAHSAVHRSTFAIQSRNKRLKMRLCRLHLTPPLRHCFLSSKPTPYCTPTPKIVPNCPTVWQKTVNPGLRTFLKLKNHLMVPCSFVIPSGSGHWPQESWGYPLGQHVKWLRQTWRRKQALPEFTLKDLEEISFAFDVNQYKWDHFTKPALCCYFDIHGNTEVPYNFRIPCGDSKWPKKLWGFPLGYRASSIRLNGRFQIQIQVDAELMAKLDFCHETTLNDRNWREIILPALKVFRQTYSHCDVPNSFKVPDQEPWPTAAAGIPLGDTVHNMRWKGSFAEQVARDADELKKIEFVWHSSFDKWNKCIFPALKVYAQQRGDCRMSTKFVVPYAKPWPERAYGKNLGMIIYKIRRASLYFDQIARNVDELASVGFEVEIVQPRWDRRVEPLLAQFEELYGHRDIPVDFIVPSEAPWKKKDWGIQLGKLL